MTPALPVAPRALVGREVELTIICGITDPDPDVEGRIVALRIEIGAPSDETACGGPLAWWDSYRCVECGRWFHRHCILRHFAAHQGTAPTPDAASSLVLLRSA
jgi:hypothetical protein